MIAGNVVIAVDVKIARTKGTGFARISNHSGFAA
ncbi:hypothetical protein D030_3644A, partial [Vibrio parahaemolyticus AQ3810]